MRCMTSAEQLFFQHVVVWVSDLDFESPTAEIKIVSRTIPPARHALYNLRPVKSFLILCLALVFAGCAGSSSAPQPQAVARPAVQKAPDEDAAIAAIAAVNAAQKVYRARYHRYALSYEELMQGVFL